MNVLFCTQSESLNLFYQLSLALDREIRIQKSGFIIADSASYQRWLKSEPYFEHKSHLLLKEWEVTARPLGVPNIQKICNYERSFGASAGLFGALVADRRIFMGPGCSYTQDYRRRFTDSELLFLLQSGLESVEKLFDQLRPDLVVGFICVTYLDYLAYLMACSRGIKFLNLRPTRVSDRVSFSTILNDPSPELTSAYDNILKGNPSEYKETARSYISRVRESHGRYEGVISPSNKPALQTKFSKFIQPNKFLSAISQIWNYATSASLSDNHVPNPLIKFFYTAFLNPFRARLIHQMLANTYIRSSDLPNIRYAFYPLHTEPEVSLLVYGRPYINQIEIIRMLALSLPSDMVLIVKEHPWMVGKRSLSAYKKLLNIPRVKLISSALDARTLITHADLVCVVTGSVALEAAMLGKPVITFGDCPYNLLPDTMITRCKDPRNLHLLINDILLNYEFNESFLSAYIQAVYETSASVNLYSVLLGKSNVYSERSADYKQEISKLMSHLLESYGESDSLLSNIDTATW